MVSQKQLRHLDIIDWDFSSPIQGLTKNMHWYPGTFPAIVPSTIIETITEPGDIVFDPFGGIGTTAIEALRLGRRFITTDINPIALMAGYNHSGLYILKNKEPHLFNVVLDEVLGNAGNENLLKDIDIEKIDDIIAEFLSPTPESFMQILELSSSPNEESLGVWIHKETLTEISDFYKRMLVHESKFIAITGISLLSSIIKALSSQGKSWGHIADNVYPKVLIYKSLNQMLSTLVTKIQNHSKKIEFNEIPNNVGSFHIVDWNSYDEKESQLFKDNNVSLLLTSPPYGNAIDYFLSQKLSFYLIGKTEVWIKTKVNSEIGARRKRAKSNAVTIWAEQLGKAFSSFVIGMSEESLICTLMPHRDHGREAGNEVVKDVLSTKGFELIREFDRSINPLKTRQSWTSIKQETVTIYKKG